MTGLSASAVEFMNYVRAGNTVGAVFFLLSGDDVLTGSRFDDYFAGGPGQDLLKGLEGNDILIGNGGDDVLDGGEGVDTAVLSGSPLSAVTISKNGDEWQVTDRSGAYGSERLIGIERIEFADRVLDLTLSAPTVEAATGRILRSPIYDVALMTANGLMTEAEAIVALVKAADATTSVATLAYQFFTGSIPTEAGVDYLVSPTGPNTNNLNSAYYQNFNLENRYINFAVNLGKLGEGRTQFEAEYGSLSLAEATRKAYGEIFGRSPTDEKLQALLSGGRDAYFESYGRDGPNGIGTKAAMVGWLLAEAEKADVGQYAKANAAFLTDLADGAAFNIDLVGVYGRPEFDLVT